MHFEHRAGEKLFLDFAGDTVDPAVAPSLWSTIAPNRPLTPSQAQR